MGLKVDRIYLDLDGVLVDWFGGICDLLQRNRYEEEQTWPEGATTEQALNIPVNKMWNQVDRYGVGWWASLNPLPWNNELLNILSGTDAYVSFLTSPANSVFAATGKIMWIEKHFPGFQNEIHLTAQKYLLASKGTLLIDDDNENCRKFRGAGGAAVLFPQVWNGKRAHAGNPLCSVRYDLRQLGIIS